MSEQPEPEENTSSELSPNEQDNLPETEVDNSTDEEDGGMASIEIQDEELAREYRKERRQARYITYGILFLFLCIVVYVGYKMLTQGAIFEFDVLNQFIEMLREMF